MISIKQGYKQTKLGIIPEDWKIVKIKDIANVKSGATPLRSNSLYYKNACIPWVKTTDLNNSLITNTEEKISEIALKETSVHIFPKDSILIAMYGGFNQIGRTGLLTIDACSNQALSVLLFKKAVSSKYILEYLNHNVYYWKRFAASSRKDPNITKSDVDIFPIILAPLKEQEKIADILTTWDDAISLHVRLIKEKEQLKIGLMQKLLSGEVRFEGFCDKWEEVKINQIFEIMRGYVLAVSDMSQEQTLEYQYPVYSSQTKNDGLTGYYKEYLFENCLTWTTDGANAGDVNLRRGKFYCTNVCGVLKSEKGYANQCIAEILNSVTKNYVSYVGNPKLMNNTMGHIKIKIPKTIEEQEAISEVLSLVDDELNLLKKELEELKQQKKGLMQKLLTGEVRVKV